MPISSVSSLKGLTIRVQENDMMSRTIELLGAKAVQIPYGDVYSALQKLRIDGAENNLPSYVFMDHNQAAPYFYQDEHFRLPEVVMISNDARKKVEAVDPAFVNLITECAKESGFYERKLWQEEEKRAYEEAVQSGVKFTIPGEDDMLALKKAMEPLYQELGPKEQDIVQRIGDT
jgi:TRAP-type C4-dicarboxylate transport system substrate-binding protein